jgi:hypothetical protein
MNSPLEREIVPTLRVISAATAEKEGYMPITVAINPKSEGHIFQSIQSSLQGANAVWIADNIGKRFFAARKASELRELTDETHE